MKIKLKCENCGMFFYRYVSKKSKSVESKHVYCSIKCYAESISQKKEYKCEYCGKIFYKSPSRNKYNNIRFCSKQCHGNAKSLENSKIVNCSKCGKEMRVSNYYSDKLNNHYCSKECTPKASTVKCLICGKEFTVSNHFINLGQGRYCSRKCWGISQRGENSPSWNPDTDKNLRVRGSLEYKEWRYKVYERDNYSCQKCEDSNNGLVAHHIFGFSKYPKYRLSIHNGITFCKSCHELFHGEYGTRKFQPIDTFKFLYPNIINNIIIERKENDHSTGTLSKI